MFLRRLILQRRLIHGFFSVPEEEFEELGLFVGLTASSRVSCSSLGLLVAPLQLIQHKCNLRLESTRSSQQSDG